MHLSALKLTAGGDVAISFSSTGHAVTSLGANWNFRGKKALNAELSSSSATVSVAAS